MNGMTFEHGHAWPYLLLAPVFWLLLWGSIRRRRRALARYGAELREHVAGAGARATRLTVFLVLGFLTWMNPRLGQETIAVSRRGLDLVFCLDTSRSMLARDIDPNRLERAKRDVFSALPLLVGGDRVALVAFAGKARLVVPLTHDLDAFRELVERVDTDTVRLGGTDLAAAIREGLELVEKDSAQTTVFVMLTDGEDLTGAGKQAAKEAADSGVVVHAIGYGSTRGSKITVDEDGNESFLQSRDGDEVVSALDPDGLEAMTAVTGGEFLRADVVPLPVVELKHKRLDPMVKRAYDAGEDVVHKTRFQWILLPAVLVLLLEMVLAKGSRR
ncbi:MAG: VWA domain-containing protein [Planctomycetes bacterium]|nr:VWA domain-containing protein [Planctomycetota bacterium]